jgi:DNA-binding CsgD family transcriptional regulator
MTTLVKNDLTLTQLTIVMHLANGLTLREIAREMSCSRTSVCNHLGTARKKLDARTLPQLVSVVIATGQLEMGESGKRVISA